MENNVLQEALVSNYLCKSGCITKEQVGGPLMAQWKSLCDLVCSIANELRKRDWTTQDERRKLQECSDIYDAATAMYALLGEVNGHVLPKPHDFDLLMVAYARKAMNAEDAFRCQVEYFIAREILIQRAKSQQILEHEREDRKMMSSIKRSQRRKKLSQNEQIKHEDSTNNAVDAPAVLEFTSFVVVCNVFKCNKNHEIEPIRAVVETITSLGEKHMVEIPAGYCKDCDIYFIFESDFKKARAQGILLCQIVSYGNYKNNTTTEFNGMELKAESVLHQSGYNVGAADDLTSVQRQEILRRVIDSELYSISGLLSFLDWLIERNKKVTNKNMNAALSKWEEDRKYIAAYRSNEQRRVGVERISHAKQCE